MLPRCNTSLPSSLGRLAAANFTACRRLSAQQAAAALRPFYNIVHPDRFGREPDVRAGNERALQAFNGYLNECLDASRARFALPPITVTFAVRRRPDDALETVHIRLAGGDVTQIVRTALECCRLSTAHLPSLASISRTLKSYSHSVNVTSDDGRSATWTDADDLWRQLHESALRRRKCSETARPPPNDLTAWAAAYSDDASARRRSFERTRDELDDRVHELVRKTGLKEVLWTINWNQSYMRRCLAGIDDMISQADATLCQTITLALMDRLLILGRGSHVCCDGSLQFGADDATGAWQKVCHEVNAHAFELHHLRMITDRVRELLGGAELLVPSHASLLDTTDRLKTFIVRVSLRDSAACRRIAALAGRDTTVEVMNAYCELSVAPDGCLQMPCNVDADALEAFLSEHAAASCDIRRVHVRQQALLTELARRCCYELGLRALTWETGHEDAALSDALRRLVAEPPPERRQALRGLALHISHAPDVHLLPNGALAIPIGWR